MADYGRVIAVVTNTPGDQLVGSHSIGATGLQLDDSSDFPEDGGTVSTDLGLLDFTTVDPETDIMTLVNPLPTGLPDESRIDLWDEEVNAVATETTAFVMLEGAEDNGDPYRADVPHGLRGYLPEGLRSDNGEIVRINTDTGEVANVESRTPALDGEVVYHPHSFRTTTKTIGTASVSGHVLLNGWADVETDGITFATATWTTKTPGWYEMNLSGEWDANATGARRLRILINGNLYAVRLEAADPTDTTWVQLITQARLNEGDLVTAWAWQSSGARLAVAASFALYRISV